MIFSVASFTKCEERKRNSHKLNESHHLTGLFISAFSSLWGGGSNFVILFGPYLYLPPPVSSSCKHYDGRCLFVFAFERLIDFDLVVAIQADPPGIEPWSHDGRTWANQNWNTPRKKVKGTRKGRSNRVDLKEKWRTTEKEHYEWPAPPTRRRWKRPCVKITAYVCVFVFFFLCSGVVPDGAERPLRGKWDRRADEHGRRLRQVLFTYRSIRDLPPPRWCIWTRSHNFISGRSYSRGKTKIPTKCPGTVGLGGVYLVIIHSQIVYLDRRIFRFDLPTFRSWIPSPLPTHLHIHLWWLCCAKGGLRQMK